VAEQQAEKEKEPTIILELTPKEAAMFHMVYFTGALLTNMEVDRAMLHATSAAEFASFKMNDEEILAVRKKATKLVDDIPEALRKELGLQIQPESHDQDSKE
jgi:hypothetical protein